MSYSNNPLLPKARKWAINLVLKEGLPVTIASRKAGIHRTTLWRWLKRWQALGLHGHSYLPTKSSRPHGHPKQLPVVVVRRILALREELRRCAYIIWRVLLAEGIAVSLASVGRVLARAGLTSSWYGKPVRSAASGYQGRTSKNLVILSRWMLSTLLTGAPSNGGTFTRSLT